MKPFLIGHGLVSVACLGLLASGAAAQTPAGTETAAPAASAPAASAPAASAPAAPAAPAAAAPAPAAPPELAPWTASPSGQDNPGAPNAASPAAATPAATPAAPTSPGAPSTAGARKSVPPRNRARSDGAAAALALPAEPSTPQDAPSPEVLTPVATTPNFDFSLGLGNQLVSHSGLDAFADDNNVPEFQLGLSAALSELGGAQLTAVARAGFGGTSGTNRGQPTELDTTKLGLGAELRAPVFERLYLFARVMPEAVHVSTELREESSGVLLGQDQWTFGLDGALGAVLRIADLRPSGLERGLGLFLRLEAGYAWTPEMDVELSPIEGGAPVRTEPVRLGELALSGFTFGGAIGLGY